MEKGVDEDTKSKLKLEAKKEGFVYSGELKGPEKIVYDKIPITSLTKGQELSLVAEIRTGKGKEHSKFSPGLIFYRNASEIIMDKEFYDEIKKIFPNSEIKEKGNKIVIIDDKKQEIGDVCEGIAERAGKTAEVNKRKEMILTIESFGQMPVEDIFKKSIEELKKDLKDVSKKIEKIK